MDISFLRYPLCRSKNEPALATALDTALILHAVMPVQNWNGIDTSTINSTDTSIGSSTVPIVKPINNETIKPRNQETSADRAEIQEGYFRYFLKLQKSRLSIHKSIR